MSIRDGAFLWLPLLLVLKQERGEEEEEDAGLIRKVKM